MEENAGSTDYDAHTVLLLRTICEMNESACTHLLELNFSKDLSAAVVGIANTALLPQSINNGAGLLDAPVLSILVPLIDLSYYLLHFSFRAVSLVAHDKENQQVARID